MCGIIGIVGQRPVAHHLVDALKRLEYRGYDSAGIATLVDGHIDRRRAEGKLANLESLVEHQPIGGIVGIGHTRWATHGAPTEANAHPHATGRVAVVHNGIIENFQTLRGELEAQGHTFNTETDTEVVAHLLTQELNAGAEPVEAVRRMLRRVEGAFALAMIFTGEHDLMIGARRGSPLAVGYGDGEMYLGSDALALAPLTRRLSYLDEGDWVVIRGAEAQIYDAANTPVQREIKESAVSGAMIGKGNYRHFMLKEIYEQPAVVGDTLRALFNPSTRAVQMPPLPVDLGRVSRFTINACGTAYYAGLVGKYWLEQVARVPCDVDIASEFRYREAPLPENGVAMCISQSGETVDTLESLRYAKSQGQTIISVVNVPESAIARESHATLATLAGPEIGVASTKAFTTQLTVLAALAIATGVARGSIDGAQAARLTSALLEVPARIAEVLNHDGRIREIALSVAEARDVLYLGRGSSFPIAMEGALKLKEISYIHAEGYAAGEMKHGPIALIDDSVPVVFIAPGDPLFEKTASNLHEVVARGGKPILFADRKGIAKVGAHAVHAIEMPEIDPFVAPILYAIPVQLLAYHAAVAKGTDVDQPRNLAKSVTVE
ncbi:MAG: glutamine--fructose-6-phosphate transaminase (isomerizing) [Alphaproteobacteria bacterium]|nr:glutamine--fructose-6-phosphate transaminase (isomerizing) [Alphaproteobacteria bacterium]